MTFKIINDIVGLKRQILTLIVFNIYFRLKLNNNLSIIIVIYCKVI
jgi:hypothetical protein